MGRKKSTDDLWGKGYKKQRRMLILLKHSCRFSRTIQYLRKYLRLSCILIKVKRLGFNKKPFLQIIVCSQLLMGAMWKALQASSGLKKGNLCENWDRCGQHCCHKANTAVWAIFKTDLCFLCTVGCVHVFIMKWNSLQDEWFIWMFLSWGTCQNHYWSSSYSGASFCLFAASRKLVLKGRDILWHGFRMNIA